MNTPRWREIAEELQEQIARGKYLPGDHLPTSAALAEQTGVSKLTAHKALEALQRQGIVTRDGRRGTIVNTPKKGKVGRIALILDQIDFLYSFPRPELLDGIHQGLGEDYNLVLCDSKASDQREIDLLAKMADECDGILCWPTDHSKSATTINAIRAKGVPLVLLDRIPEAARAHAVVPDSVTATQQAIEYLVKQGHQRIAVFTFDKPEVSTVVERIATYEKCMADHGLDTSGLIRKFAPSLEVSERAYFDQAVSDTLVASVKSREPITAVLCIQDLFGAVILEKAEELGIELMSDLEVVTFNDWQPSWLRKPWQAHRIAIHPEDMGAKAIEILLEQIQEGRQEPTTHRISARFIAAESLLVPDTISNIP